MERAKIFLTNPFFTEQVMNCMKIFKLRILDARQGSEADFRHLQTRVDGYRQQMEHLISQLLVQI